MNQFLDAQSLSIHVDERLRSRRSRLICKSHPLVEAAQIAFSQHRPLTLSPDAIWLVIQQGFAHHVSENAETMRAQLVRHDRKKDLSITLCDISLNSLDIAISSFSRQIKENANPVLYDALVCDFSTTSPLIRTASMVSLMDTYSHYFEYVFNCVCGIPQVNLTGTIADWEQLRSRIEVFAPYDLEWWVRRLRCVLDQIVESANGRPNPFFWQSIYKPQRVYASTMVTGWLTQLFPYLGDAPERRKNPCLELPLPSWEELASDNFPGSIIPFNERLRRGVAESSFPSGLASVPVALRLPGGSSDDLKLLGGFFAVRQDVNDMSLSPVICWSLTQDVLAPPAPQAS